MNRTIVLLGCCLLASVAFGFGDTVWLRTFDPAVTSGGKARFMDIAPDGNIVVGGACPGWGFQFVKYSPAGETIWQRHWAGPTNNDFMAAMTLDHDGNVAATGYSWTQAYDVQKGLTLKFSADGDSEWVQSWLPSGDQAARLYGVASDAQGNSYVTGTVLDNGTQYDLVLARYGADGHEDWYKTYDCSPTHGQPDAGLLVALDSTGIIYVAGQSSFWQRHAEDVTLLRYTPTGDTQWVRSYMSPDSVATTPHDMVLDRAGNIYLFGTTNEFSPTAGWVLLKYSVGGALEWSRTYHGLTGGPDKAVAMALDDSGNVYVTGSSRRESGTLNAIVTAKYRPNGDSVWCAVFEGGNGLDTPGDIVVDRFGSAYVAGMQGLETYYPTALMLKYDRYGRLAWRVQTNRGYDNNNVMALDSIGGIYAAGVSGPYENNDWTVIKYAEYSPQHDVGVTRLLQPHGTIGQGTVVTPACSVYNFGTYPETYSVRMRIGTTYDSTADVTDHAPATGVEVHFPAWTASTLGGYQVICETQLGNDSNPSNDVWYDSVYVGVPGVEECGDAPQSLLRLLSPNPQTGPCVRLSCAASVGARLCLFDAAGQLKASREVSSHVEAVQFDTRDFGSGVYLVRLSGPGVSRTLKLILMN